MTIATRSIESGTIPLIASSQTPLIIGHRGSSRRARGNSLASFSEAMREGADAIELDVRRTLDGALVIHHGATRHRVPVAQLTYSDLKRRCRHEPPTLDAVFQLCARRIAINVEIKAAGCETDVLELAARRIRLDWLLITSFQRGVITTVKQLAPDVRCGLVVGPGVLTRSRRGADQLVQAAAECGADFIVPHQLAAPLAGSSRRRPGVLEVAAVRGMPVVVWTVNGAMRMRRYLADPRVAGIITDLPGAAVGIRRELNGLRRSARR